MFFRLPGRWMHCIKRFTLEQVSAGSGPNWWFSLVLPLYPISLLSNGSSFLEIGPAVGQIRRFCYILRPFRMVSWCFSSHYFENI